VMGPLVVLPRLESLAAGILRVLRIRHAANHASAAASGCASAPRMSLDEGAAPDSVSTQEAKVEPCPKSANYWPPTTRSCAGTCTTGFLTPSA
jgi:hypothetical protein